MKHKLSVTLDEEVVLGILDLLRDDTFRNKSHAVEYAVKKMLKERKEK